MKKSILEIYALALCFSSIVCFVVALGVGVYDVAQIVNPEFTLNSHEYSRHQSNDAFWDDPMGMPLMIPGESPAKERPRPPEHELTKKREQSYQQTLLFEKRNASQGLVQVAIIIFIDCIVFMIHWWIAQHARETTANP